METRANYIVIGAFTLAAILGGLGFFIWLAKLEVNRQYDYYDVIFDNVSGLSRAADVRFNGLSVGQVMSIDLSTRFRGKVQARTQVVAGTPITEDTQAQLQAQGVTGVSFVALSTGKPDAPLLHGTDGSVPHIMAKPSTLETLAEDAPSLIREAISLLNNLQSFVSTDNQDYVAGILRNLNDASGKLQTALDDFSTISRAVADASGEIGAFTERLEPIGTSLQSALGNADKTLEAARGAFAQAETTLGTADGALGSAQRTFEGADKVMQEQIPTIVADLSTAVATLKVAVADLSGEAHTVLGSFGGTAETATARLAELKGTIAGLDATLAETRTAVAAVSSASGSVETLVKGDGAALVTQARVTLTDLSASLEGLDRVVNEEVPGVIADVRTATQTAKQVISTAGADVTEFTAGLKPLTATANTTLETATRTLHDASATFARLDTAMDTAERTLAAAEGTFGRAQRVMDEDVGPTAADIRSAAAQLNSSIADVSKDLPAITSGLREVIARANEAITRVDTTVAQSAGPVRDFATTGLPQFVRFTAEARALVTSMQQLVNRIERDPARFFLGNQAPEYRR